MLMSVVMNSRGVHLTKCCVRVTKEFFNVLMSVVMKSCGIHLTRRQPCKLDRRWVKVCRACGNQQTNSREITDVPRTRVHMCMRACARAHTHTHTHTHTCVHTHIHTHMRARTQMHAHTNTHTLRISLSATPLSRVLPPRPSQTSPDRCTYRR
jgi:hypothetical protein